MSGGRRELRFQRGPIFANIVLADEVNRATPKTQSALLEAMQEHSVTVAGTTHRLQEPFFVIATQNPIEMEGTYPLPEAQLDRFLYKVLVGYARREELNEVLGRTTGVKEADLRPVMDGTEVEAWKRFVREVAVASHVSDYASRLVLATHPGGQFASEAVNRFVRFGASPRAAQALVLGAKVTALVDGRYNVGFRDVAAVAPLALRHRLWIVTKGHYEEQLSKIQRCGIAFAFQGFEILPEKSPETFQEMVDRHGFDRGTTWMIGNSPRSDVNPALRVGLRTVFIPHRTIWEFEREELLAPPDLSLKSFPEMLDHF